MSYQLLLVVERPDLSIPENETKWKKWKDQTVGISTQDTSLEVLSENVVVLRLNNALSRIGMVLTCLNGLNYRYALFDTEIQWHAVSKDNES